ncbi:hypothetical protein AVEN_110450-1 [Araneus ventricosus]|uniref:Uncharacterized protein n=1 Tax=Araneus ventricosus TaxID=182803 RepID=A0A4Y2HZL0_ARAVE|nr:hypothetical protein AVEN_110450-1 [Araneus ventricosus]
MSANGTNVRMVSMLHESPNILKDTGFFADRSSSNGASCHQHSYGMEIIGLRPVKKVLSVVVTNPHRHRAALS